MKWRAISAGPIARHVIQRMMNPHFLRQIASYDPASCICQAHCIIQRIINPRVTHYEPSCLESDYIL